MADNTVTSKTGTAVATGTDIAFGVTFKLAPRRQSSKVFLMVKYTKAISDLVMTFDFICGNLSATDKYRMTWQDANDDLDGVTVTLAATGNRRIPIDVSPNDTSLVVNVGLATTNSGDAAVIELLEE